MCLILFAYKIDEKYPLILASNRDEFYQRPTSPMAYWEDHPSLLAGRDLQGGGTWFGVNKSGRFGAITNYRDPADIKTDAPSRGEIIVDFLNSDSPANEFLADLKGKGNRYNGFNLLLKDRKSLFWFSNKKDEIREIPPGIHGISNHFLNTPWPKVESGKKAMESTIKTPFSAKSLFPILLDNAVAQDKDLPQTGVGLEWERILSPLFIKSQVYGTRASTVMLIDKNETIQVAERSYPDGDTSEFKENKFIIKSH